jgi:hypothetical protein
MKAEVFYPKMIAMAAQAPAERYVSLTHLHTAVITPYLQTVRAMTAQDAARVSGDGRTVGQVVGHVAKWERFNMLAVGEIIAGVRWPQIMHLSGHVEPDGQVRAFSYVAAFNAYQAAKHAAWSWEQIQDLAIYTATTFQRLFAHPSLLSWERLEQTKAYRWLLPNAMRVTVSCRWYVWMITLAHAAVAHAADLEQFAH